LRSPAGSAYVAAHRGDLAAPENTIPALEAAIASGADFVEVDVQLTADGVPVLMHDWTVDRTTDGEGFVWQLDFKQIRALDAGSWHSPEYAGLQVPTLKQFLDLLRGSDVWALVELKGTWNVEQLVTIQRLLLQADAEGRVVLASFDIMTLRSLERVAPHAHRAIVAREIHGDPAVLAEASGASIIISHHRFLRSSPEVVWQAQRAGLSVFAYTLNDEHDWSRALRVGIDGIITDTPTELTAWLATNRG
jgi:glycerophosphoryl diester phosphodiesterase